MLVDQGAVFHEWYAFAEVTGRIEIWYLPLLLYTLVIDCSPAASGKQSPVTGLGTS